MKFGLKKDEKEVRTERERVEERREEVLAQGRKFKYPLQYAKHKLVINTIIVAILATVALALAGWTALYKFQDIGDIMYRISGVVPVPVAKIDDENVRFYDYLMMVRSSLKTLEQQSGLDNTSDDKKAMTDQYKRVALTKAEDFAYALKVGRELGVEVTDEEIDQVFDERRKIGGIERNEESFLRVLSTNFGLSKNEYRRMLYLSIMRAKVEEQIDENAKKVAKKIEEKLSANDNNFEQVKEELGEAVDYQSTDGMVDNKNIDGGRAEMASRLEPGAQSGRFLSTNGDGYYFVKLKEKTETQVNYVSLFIKFSELDKRLAEIREQERVKEYIVIPTIEDEPEENVE